VILLNERGEVAECTSANISSRAGNQGIDHPPLSSGCLPGVDARSAATEISLRDSK